ncbi:hypothetical protein LNP17_11915 [Klebsiella variicola subsp. variicola]|nr:hypothetical protein [Klebsiella variicola subsp. variicola]
MPAGDKYLTPLNMVDSAKILPGDKSPTAKQLAEIGNPSGQSLIISRRAG